MASRAFHRRWFVYAFWIAAWPLIGTLMLLPAAARGWAAFALGVAIIVAAVWALAGYYLDAKHQRAVDASWVPTWWLWCLCHILLSPVLIAPVYLLIRTLNTGAPFGTWEDAGRWIGSKF